MSHNFNRSQRQIEDQNKYNIMHIFDEGTFFDYTFRGNEFAGTQFYQSFEAIHKGTI